DLPTLVPRDGRIDLFVTITDFYGYDRQIPIADPLLVHDQRHRHALTFAYEAGEVDQFGEDDNGSLAFAARATSCFPGVFPPGSSPPSRAASAATTSPVRPPSERSPSTAASSTTSRSAGRSTRS